MNKRLVAVVLTLLSVSPLQASEPLDPYLGSRGDCYARKYDQAHLRDHPRQMVETFSLSHHDSYQDPQGDVTLKFGFSTRNGRDYEGVAVCQGNACWVEGDGGAFMLTPSGGGLRLDVDAKRGMAAEGAVDVVELNDTDDTVFLLYPAAREQCI